MLESCWHGVLPLNLFCVATATALAAGAAAQPEQNFGEMGIEDLMRVKVTSASRSEASFALSPYAVYVVTGEELVRSGATSLPEALRLVPGVHVAQINAYTWAVSTRGNNGRFTNKLLVMIDGRSVYSSAFAGVYWDSLDMPMEDIERIEVIRGPGAAVWGANAVNGVINVITKSAERTQGTLASASGGSEIKAGGTLRHGGELGAGGAFRVFAKGSSMDRLGDVPLLPANDSYRSLTGGFRLDFGETEGDSWTVHGGAFDLDEEMTVTYPLSAPFSSVVEGTGGARGHHLMGRWERNREDGSVSLQAFYSRSDREPLDGALRAQTLDLDFVSIHRLDEHQLTWGLNLRSTSDDLESTLYRQWRRKSVSNTLCSGFGHWEYAASDRLSLSAGGKLEKDANTSWEFMPNARAAYSHRPDTVFWVGASRAIRSPSRVEQDVLIDVQLIPGDPPTIIRVEADGTFKREELISYELGYRYMPNSSFSFDLAAFYNEYENLKSFETGTPSFEIDPFPHIRIPINLANDLNSRQYGIELFAQYSPAKNWKISSAYSLLATKFWYDAGASDPFGTGADGGDTSPRHMFNLRTAVRISDAFDFDAQIYYVDALRKLDVPVPAYWRADVRAAYRPTLHQEVVVGATNLFGPGHREYALYTGAVSIQPSFCAHLVWRF